MYLQRSVKLIRIFSLLTLAAITSACGNDSPFSPPPVSDTSGTRIGANINGSFTEGAISISPDAISTGETSTVSVDIVDVNGQAVLSSASVTFSSTCVTSGDASFGSTTVTTTTGNASTSYIPQGCSGQDTITASLNTTTQTATGTVTIATSTIRFGSTVDGTFIDGLVVVSPDNISSNGTASISVDITDATGNLITTGSSVTFSSTCASAGTASFGNATVVTITGSAVTTYNASGCTGIDTITATLASAGLTATGTVTLGSSTTVRIGSSVNGSFNEGVLSIPASAIAAGTSSDITIDIVDSAGNPINASITIDFSSACVSSGNASFTNPSFTTTSGTATTTYLAQGCTGNDLITATLRGTTQTATGTITVATTTTRFGSTVNSTFVDGLITVSPSIVSIGGLSFVSVDITDASGNLKTDTATVVFSSPCATAGTASFGNTSVVTITGTAGTTYNAGTCPAGADPITATFGSLSATGTVTIASTTASSIQLTAVSNSIIALSGTGSSSLPENASVSFIVKDNDGLPIQNESVTFSLNSTVGGISLSTTNATTDETGQVITTVQSGTVATSVRVTATVDSNTTLSTTSSTISISTGPPDQNSISLSASELNPRAWNVDGKTVTISARLADRFNNPITDGTSISFTTELGAIDASCTTVNGGCDVIWRSQSPRTNDLPAPGQPGITTIIATVEGEESFSDVDANGVFSDGDSFTDLGEAYRDDNDNAAYDAGEFYVDFDSSGDLTPANGLYNGKGCTHSTLCDPTSDAVTVRASLVLAMAENAPNITSIQYNNSGTVVAGTPFSTATDSSITFTITGPTNDNILPLGTTIKFTSTNSKIVGGAEYTVANTVYSNNTYTVFIIADGNTDPGVLNTEITMGDSGSTFNLTPIAIDNTVVSGIRIGSIISSVFTEGVVTLSTNSITAGGSTNVSVDIVDLTGTPVTNIMTVDFASSCVSSSLATFTTPTVVTTNGNATTTYTDQGCSGADLITATIAGTTQTAAATVNISATPPVAGSIELTSIANQTIALAGTGSASGLPETTSVTFTVKDALGNPVQGEAVSFALNNVAGGVNLSNTNIISDNNGQVSTTVQSGTVATNVRVTATLDSNTAITIASDPISIATGPPDQNSMTLKSNVYSPRAWDVDGAEVIITAHAADRFNNPITDGTLISFTTELGAIQPSCSTVGGSCSVTWISQNPRSNTFDIASNVLGDGISTILATIEGEESFVDADSNGVYSTGDSFTDLPEAFMDVNDNGTYDPGEFFVDINSNGSYDTGDTIYNGKGCTTGGTDCDPAFDAITVRQSLQLLLAEDNPVVTQASYSPVTGAVAVNPLPAFNTSVDNTASITLAGVNNGKNLPEGTLITFSTTNGSLDLVTTEGQIYFRANPTDPSKINIITVGRSSTAQIYDVQISTDGTPSADGFLYISVTIPSVPNEPDIPPFNIQLMDIQD